jgi:hypothetical protein
VCYDNAAIKITVTMKGGPFLGTLTEVGRITRFPRRRTPSAAGGRSMRVAMATDRPKLRGDLVQRFQLAPYIHTHAHDATDVFAGAPRLHGLSVEQISSSAQLVVTRTNHVSTG